MKGRKKKKTFNFKTYSFPQYGLPPPQIPLDKVDQPYPNPQGSAHANVPFWSEVMLLRRSIATGVCVLTAESIE